MTLRHRRCQELVDDVLLASYSLKLKGPSANKEAVKELVGVLQKADDALREHDGTGQTPVSFKVLVATRLAEAKELLDQYREQA